MTISRADDARRLWRKFWREARDKNRWRKIVKVRLWMPVLLQMSLVAGLALYANSRFPNFLNENNIYQILLLALPLIVATWAQTNAILVGYLDLSVAGMISFGVVVGSFLIPRDAGIGAILLGLSVILGAGLVLGLINAGLIRGIKMPSIVATLGTMSVLSGIALTMRPTAQGSISATMVGWLRTRVGPFPVVFIVLFVGAALLDAWLHGTGSGLRLRGTGFDDRSARRSGIRTTWIRVRALMLTGFLAALASIMVMADRPTGNARIGDTFALASITAAVLGGASLMGGRATFIGGTVAAVLLALILTVLPYIGLSNSDGQLIVGVLVLVGIILFQIGDLKELIKTTYRKGKRIYMKGRPPKETVLPDFYPEGTDFRITPTGRKLIKGGMVLTLDPEGSRMFTGDVLVEGERIVQVGRNLQNTDAELIDATGTIVMPGFVDTHRHIWEGLLRNIGTDVPLEGRTSYISHVLHKLAPAFRPEDAYVGNLVSALGAIDAGVTTLLDWSHIQGSPAHTDAVIQALHDSGLRAVFAYGFPWWGKWEERQPSWFVRAANEHFSTRDQKLTLALAAPGPEFTDFETSRDHWKLAREAGARITTHVGVGSYGQAGKLQRFGEGGQMGRDTTYIHCTTLNITEIQMIVDTGGTVSLASPVEMMMGHGMPPIQKFLDRGLNPSLSVDVETNVPADMFNQMRSVLGLQRALAVSEGKDRISAVDVLRYATIEGARANGLDDRVGTLTPGKQADIILLRTDRLNVTPLNDPATAIVVGMDTSNVDTVLIAGRLMKQNGRLLHVDWPAVRRMADSARDHVIEKSGFKLPKL